jgi:hypothetical protein
MRGDSSDSDTTSGDTGGLSLSQPLPVECTKPYLKVESHFFLGRIKATKKVVTLSTLLVVACGPELNLLLKAQATIVPKRHLEVLTMTIDSFSLTNSRVLVAL